MTKTTIKISAITRVYGVLCGISTYTRFNKEENVYETSLWIGEQEVRMRRSKTLLMAQKNHQYFFDIAEKLKILFEETL